MPNYKVDVVVSKGMFLVMSDKVGDNNPLMYEIAITTILTTVFRKYTEVSISASTDDTVGAECVVTYSNVPTHLVKNEGFATIQDMVSQLIVACIEGA